jgi:hypothetical protein
MRSIRPAVASFVVSLFAFGAAQATTGVEITATGTWYSTAPTTNLSAPSATFSLSFTEPTPFPQGDAVGGGGWISVFPEAQLSGSYMLNSGPVTLLINNTTVPLAFSSVQYYVSDGTPDNSGGVDVNFSTGSAQGLNPPISDTLSIYSNSTYADTSGNIAALAGDQIFVSYDDGAYEGSGTLSITSGATLPSNPNNPGPGNYGNPPGIPEPSDWILMMVGAGMVGGLQRRRRESARLAFVGRILPEGATNAGR